MNTTHGTGSRLAELSAFDCWQLLETAEIVRIAWNGPRGVSVVPVNFRLADGALWFRTTPYAALAREAGDQWVAAEVDHLDAGTRSGWSVVLRGSAELVAPVDVPDHLVDFRIWPQGHQSLFVRILPVEVTGRRLLPTPDGGQTEI
jgi:hypothetical protein